MEALWADADVISVYTRAQAIEDGELVDMSSDARQAGILWPLAVTRAVWTEYIVPDERSRPYGQSESGRTWDVVNVLAWYLRARKRQNLPVENFWMTVQFIMKARRKRNIPLYVGIGPGDEGEPCITIMTGPEEM